MSKPWLNDVYQTVQAALLLEKGLPKLLISIDYESEKIIIELDKPEPLRASLAPKPELKLENFGEAPSVKVEDLYFGDADVKIFANPFFGTIHDSPNRSGEGINGDQSEEEDDTPLKPDLKLNEQPKREVSIAELGDYPNQPYLPDFPNKNGRRFQYKWFLTYPWLSYSVERDVAFCFACQRFGAI